MFKGDKYEKNDRYNYYENNSRLSKIRVQKQRNGVFLIEDGLYTRRGESLYLLPLEYCPINSGWVKFEKNRYDNGETGMLWDRGRRCQVQVQRVIYRR